MINLTLKNVKTVLWFRRVFVFFCMICCTVFVYGKGSKWTATYQVDVDNSRSTGSGLVYMTAGSYANTTSPNDFAVIGDVNSSEILVTPTNPKQTLSVKRETDEIDGTTDKQEEWTNTKVKFTNITLHATASPGSKFIRWEDNDGNVLGSTALVAEEVIIQTEKGNDGNAKNMTSKSPAIYYPIFEIRTYYYQSPGATVLDTSMVYVCTDGVRPEDSSDKWKTNIPVGSTQSKSADGAGQYGQATVTYYFYAKAPADNYELLGWFDQSGKEVDVKNDGSYSLVTSSDNPAAPTTIVLTPKFVPSNPYDTITKTNLNEVELYTGVEGTQDVFPYSPKKRIDLSKIFGTDDKALFDSLYIFGETISTNGQPLVDIMGAGYPNIAGETPIPNAITPCYVYMKSDENTYTLQRTIQNMNPKSSVKPIPDITANGQKLYFTGYCPYASSGVTTQIGVFHIKGGAGAKVDVYLDDLYLYARFHTSNGWGYFPTEGGDTYGVTVGIVGESYIPVSASPFVFSSTSTNNSNPFTPAIHICDSNKLEGGTGHIQEQITDLNAGIYSAPIHLYVTATNQVTSLTIDDEWPISTTEKVRTNGKLNLIPTYLGRPCIELGNDNSTVNINGGQLYFKNAVPFTSTYRTTFAIGSRKYAKSVASLSGMGEDQPGGNVNFNDGTIYCVPITEADMNAYSGCYRNTSSMKCPRNTKINGGNLLCDIWACDGAQSIGASPTNQYGDSLVSVRLKINNTPTSPYYIATVNFDSLALVSICRDASNTTYYGTTLADYYDQKSGTYNHASMKADATDSVTFMLPYYFTNKRIFGDETVKSWALALPTIKLNAGFPLGNLTFGGPDTMDTSGSQHTRFLLFAQLGTNAMEAVGPNASPRYRIPKIGQFERYEAQVVKDSYYEDIVSEEAYTIQEAQYLIRPIEAADEWMLFSPPFDVTKVYVLETFPEDSLKKVPNLEDAYKIQTQSLLDFAFYFCYNIDFMEQDVTFDAVYNQWQSDPNLTKGPGKVQLTHFTGTNYDANYYLQRSSGDWDWNETEQKFTTDWQFVTPEQVDHGGTMYDVVMKKGEIYSMKFPYMYYGYSQKTGKWDYWTGKYLLFEGLGEQTIEGENYHSSICYVSPALGKAAVRVNSTFATMRLNEEDAFVLSPDMSTGNQKFTAPTSDDPIEIEPTSGYVMVDHTMPAMSMPGRKATIDMMSGVVTYEDDETTSLTPTIAGSRKLLVYNTNGGLILLPVVPQSVAIYNAAGVLVDNQYVTEQTVVALPAGAYFVRGEYDQAKAIVK